MKIKDIIKLKKGYSLSISGCKVKLDGKKTTIRPLTLFERIKMFLSTGNIKKIGSNYYKA